MSANCCEKSFVKIYNFSFLKVVSAEGIEDKQVMSLLSEQ